MKKPASKFGLTGLVSQAAPETANPSVDALLFAPTTASSPAPPSVSAEDSGKPLAAKTRFTNVLPTATYVQLHQLAFWDRRDMSAIMDAALQEYFASRPEAARPLPEEERTKRKLPLT